MKALHFTPVSFLPYPFLFLAAEAAVGARNEGVLFTPLEVEVVDEVLEEADPEAADDELEGEAFVEEVEATDRRESEVLLLSLSSPCDVLLGAPVELTLPLALLPPELTLPLALLPPELTLPFALRPPDSEVLLRSRFSRD